jgi:EAL domain-containing protein (putative c-di-GMP-specific phosphodiesterase class I)
MAEMNTALLSGILAGTRPAITYVHPIMGLRSGHVEAKEVLTRFIDDRGALLTVGGLFDDASLGLEDRIRLDLACLETLFRTLARHPITDHLIFLNLNPMTLAYPAFWERIRPWMWDLSIPPHRIVLEITERQNRHGLDRLEGYVARLRELEFRIAVDDVGSGVASLTHLARLTPDFMKVDRSLVRDVERRPHQAALLQALAGFATRTGMGYIAEGIETTAELQAVTEAGVPWGQGFLFGEPEPLTL